jgi:hypothetical protein
MHDDKRPIAIPLDRLKTLAREVAAAMSASESAGATPAATGGGSVHRGLGEDLRLRFIDVRAALFQRGIFDPVLVRFDTATAPQATTSEIAQQLSAVAESL